MYINTAESIAFPLAGHVGLNMIITTNVSYWQREAKLSFMHFAVWKYNSICLTILLKMSALQILNTR